MWKEGDIRKGFLRQKLGVCTLSEIKGKGEVMFIEVVGRVYRVRSGREGMALLLSRWLLRCVLEWKVSSRLMWLKSEDRK